jgi:hypothetical protein
MKKPVSKEDLAACQGEGVTSIDQATELVTHGLERAKAHLFTDEEFLSKVFRHCMDSPELVVREIKEVAEKETQLLIRGRTNKLKLIVFLSDAELEQWNSIKKLRGDRTLNDSAQAFIVLGLASLRAI